MGLGLCPLLVRRGLDEVPNLHHDLHGAWQQRRVAQDHLHVRAVRRRGGLRIAVLVAARLFVAMRPSRTSGPRRWAGRRNEKGPKYVPNKETRYKMRAHAQRWYRTVVPAAPGRAWGTTWSGPRKSVSRGGLYTPRDHITCTRPRAALELPFRFRRVVSFQFHRTCRMRQCLRVVLPVVLVAFAEGQSWHRFVAPEICLQRFNDRIARRTSDEVVVTDKVERLFRNPTSAPTFQHTSIDQLIGTIAKARNVDTTAQVSTVSYHGYHAYRQAATVLAAAISCKSLKGAPCQFQRVVDVGSKGDTALLIHKVFGVPNEGNVGTALDDAFFEGPYFYLDDAGVMQIQSSLPTAPPPSFWTEVRKADIVRDRLPVKQDASLDAIFALETLEHLHSPWFFMREVVRTLKVGGLLVLSTPNLNSAISLDLILTQGHPGTSPAYAAGASPGSKSQSDGAAIPGHVHEFSLREMRQLVAFAGLRIISHTTLDYQADYTDKILGGAVQAYSQIMKSARYRHMETPTHWMRQSHLLVAVKDRPITQPLRDLYSQVYGTLGRETWLWAANHSEVVKARREWPLPEDCPELELRCRSDGKCRRVRWRIGGLPGEGRG